MSTRWKVVIAAVVLGLVVAVVLTALAVANVWRHFEEPDFVSTPTNSPAPEGLDRFYHQELDWTACGQHHCAWIRVPVDYADPGGETLRLRVVRVEASGGHGTRTLFVNPGGPGASAMDFAVRMAGAVGAKVASTYDIVGVDPRGVGQSTPLSCLSDPDFDTFIDGDPTPDDPAEARAYERSSTTLGKACQEHSGALADHVSTAEVARDMDIARALLGRPKLDWFGASYGTDLGATYATLFPHRVGRMVLDGAVDPSLDAFESAMAQAVGFDRALDAFIAACAKAKDCPLESDHAGAVRQLQQFLADLDAHPLPVGDRRLTEGRAYFGLALPLYDRGAWDVLTVALRTAFAGDGEALLRLSDLYFSRDVAGDFADNSGQVIFAVSCLDADDRPSEKQVRAQLPTFAKASPVFGGFLGWAPLGCTGWPALSNTPQPAIDATGAPPILVLGTTRDPATPYESAVALAQQLRVGVLISRDGDGHTAYLSGNPCITTTVDAFLTAGIVPQTDPHC